MDNKWVDTGPLPPGLETHEFCDTCEGCRPAMLDLKTNRPMPQDHPTMKKINKVWDNDTTYEQRRAFIDVTLHSRKTRVNMLLANQVMELIKAVL